MRVMSSTRHGLDFWFTLGAGSRILKYHGLVVPLL
jgi:hypothetical protein